MTELSIQPKGALQGEIKVPGDKSVSHRSLLLNLLANGSARIEGLLASEDVQSTQAAVEALGAVVVQEGQGLRITPPATLSEPEDVLDCGNSGTTIRLLCGLLASEPFLTVLTGDHSLRKRPMGRVTVPLRELGASLTGRQDGKLAPLVVKGGQMAPGQRFDLSIASAQVKTALLLAGRKVGISVREPGQSRDHTERMLRQMGADLTKDEDGWLHLAPTPSLKPLDVQVPGDVSSAAFFLVAASVVPGSDVWIRGVGMNPTRTGVVDALLAMGAQIEVHPVQAAGAEPIADLHVTYRGLKGARIDGDLALRSLDELPVLAVAAAFAEGTTTIADAEELRVKESDRIARVVEGLKALSVDVEEHPDGMTIQGGRPLVGPAAINARGDHRIAMAFAVAGMVAPGGVCIEGAEAISTSYPTFLAHVEALRG